MRCALVCLVSCSALVFSLAVVPPACHAQSCRAGMQTVHIARLAVFSLETYDRKLQNGTRRQEQAQSVSLAVNIGTTSLTLGWREAAGCS